jgi:hypothetical protein
LLNFENNWSLKNSAREPLLTFKLQDFVMLLIQHNHQNQNGQIGAVGRHVRKHVPKGIKFAKEFVKMEKAAQEVLKTRRNVARENVNRAGIVGIGFYRNYQFFILINAVVVLQNFFKTLSC